MRNISQHWITYIKANPVIARSVIGILLVNLFVFTLAYRSLSQSKQQYEEQAEIVTRNLAQTLDVTISGIFDRVNSSLVAVESELNHQLLDGAINTARLNTFINTQRQNVAGEFDLRVTDASGMVRFGSGVTPDLQVSTADRDFFLKLKEAGCSGAFIGKPIKSRITGKWVLVIARRYTHPDGKFAGVVLSPIPLEHIVGLFSSLDLGEHAAISLRDSELAIIARIPEPDGIGSSIGQKKLSTTVIQSVQTNPEHGTYTTEVIQDNVRRTISYRKLSRYPLYVFVGQAPSDYLANWHREAMFVTGLVVVFTLLTLFMTWQLYRRWIKEKIVNETLRNSEQRFRAMIESSPLAVIVTDGAEMQNEYLNPKFSELFGYTIEDVPGVAAWWPLAYPDETYRSQVKAEWERRVGVAVATRSVIEPMEVVVTCKDGSTKTVEFNLTSLGEKSVVFANDLTERKYKEKALEESERRYRELVENAPIGIYKRYLEGEGEYLYVNPSLARSFHCHDADNYIERYGTVSKRWRYPDKHAEFISLMRENGHVYDYEVESKLDDGTSVWSSLFCTLDANDNTIYGWALDITDHKRLEDQVHQAQKLESVGLLAGGIAHDFNNLLTPIFGFGEMLCRVHSPEEKAYSWAVHIIEAADRAKNLIKQLLQFSRKQVLSVQKHDLSKVASSFLSILRRTIRENIEIQLNVSEIPCPVMIDCTQIEQILLNLAVNAQDAIDGVGTLSIETAHIVIDDEYIQQHPGASSGRYIMLSVSDNGAGIDEATLTHLFEPFFTTKALGHGTGLGLATVYGIVNQHKGFVDVISKPSHGTTFHIYLPEADDVSTQENLCQSKTKISRITASTILVAEDNPMVMAYVRELLEHEGHNVIAGECPEKALYLGRENADRITLLISDMIMPKMNGLELYEQLKNVIPGLKVLFMSGYTSMNAHRGLAEGKANFITKPFTSEEFFTKIRNVYEVSE